MTGSGAVIAVIPARGGSKSVPRKNIKLLGGKPLLAWSIETAQRVAAIDRVIVSTDDDEIAAVAERYRAEVYRRPAELASDTALVIDALRDLYRRLVREDAIPEVMLLLEPTCPFRLPEDIEQCLALLQNGYDSVATFTEALLHPHRAWKIENSEPQVFVPGAVPWRPRQELPQAYQLNGAVYAFDARVLNTRHEALLFGRQGAVLMPGERSVDIDSELDFIVADSVLEGMRG